MRKVCLYNPYYEPYLVKIRESDKGLSKQLFLELQTAQRLFWSWAKTEHNDIKGSLLEYI